MGNEAAATKGLGRRTDITEPDEQYARIAHVVHVHSS
jgi:hypothetical protein